MIKKYTTLSFVFCSLILSSTLTSMISCAAPETQKAETQDSVLQVPVANLTPEATLANFDTENSVGAQRKTTKQRIVSGLAHAALLGSSAFVACTILKETERTDSYEDLLISAVLLATSLQSFYSGAEGIYDAIKNNSESPSSPATKAVLTKDALLAVASGVVFQRAYSSGSLCPLDIIFSIPAIYCLLKSIKTFHSATQQSNAISASQEPKIPAIIE